MPTFSQFFPSTITLNADDPSKLETIAAWMTQASPRLAALPGFVDAIQPTWTAQILSNPLGTIRDTAAALGPSGRLATDATHLKQIAQRVRGTDSIHEDLLNRVAGGAGRQTFAATSSVTGADLQWLADEAAFLETGSAITDRYGAAAQAVVDNWTPPAGQPDTIRYTLLETRTALYPTANAVKDMATTLRGVHDRLVATLSANATLAAQLQAAATKPTPSEGGSAPPKTTPTVTVQPAPASNAAWWLLAGLAVAGVGVYAITRPSAGARKNPMGPVPPEWRKQFGLNIVEAVRTYQGNNRSVRRLNSFVSNNKIVLYFWDAGTDLYHSGFSPNSAAASAIKNV